MNVTLSESDILEACKEWLEKHYGVQANTIASSFTVYRATVTGLQLEVNDVPKPEQPYR